uniref:Dirigent protein n=1 Tax=Leersia perrieri TaxID=77586 RepID=A0A0D9XQC4_9ORYZ
MASLLLGSGFLLLAAAVFLHHHHNTTTTTTTHLHFYMHDTYTGPNPTATRVISGHSLLPNSTTTPSSSLPRQFGDIVVLNNALTEAPSASSARVGTAQGFAVRVSEGGVVSDLSMHLVVEAGEHKGGSVMVKGRIDVNTAVRESVVVGGTGRFRLARGYMISKSYEYSLATGV